MSQLDNTRPGEKERLNNLYWQAGMSERDIASALNTTHDAVRRALDRHGIERREQGGQRKGYATYKVRKGYPIWWSGPETCRVHQLLAISDGNDPHEVFADDTVVHHKNGVRWDNRVENLEVMSRTEHANTHCERGDITPPDVEEKYSDRDLLDWIDSFAEEFGVTPSITDARTWPGPSPPVYKKRFGSWRAAVREAGYTPRGVSE